MNMSRVSIFAGESDLTKEDQGSRHLIDNCVVHPEYVELNNSDVAVCRLQTPFPMSDKIQPIPLDGEYVGGDINCVSYERGKFQNILVENYQIKCNIFSADDDKFRNNW